MSAVELLPPISPEVITREGSSDAEDLNGIHLYKTADPECRPLCGAPLDFGHDCPMYEFRVGESMASCPNCGRPTCVYCRLLV